MLLQTFDQLILVRLLEAPVLISVHVDSRNEAVTECVEPLEELPRFLCTKQQFQKKAGLLLQHLFVTFPILPSPMLHHDLPWCPLLLQNLSSTLLDGTFNCVIDGCFNCFQQSSRETSWSLPLFGYAASRYCVYAYEAKASCISSSRLYRGTRQYRTLLITKCCGHSLTIIDFDNDGEVPSSIK